MEEHERAMNMGSLFTQQDERCVGGMAHKGTTLTFEVAILLEDMGGLNQCATEDTVVYVSCTGSANLMFDISPNLVHHVIDTQKHFAHHLVYHRDLHDKNECPL